jgi:hypothetical protein
VGAGSVSPVSVVMFKVKERKTEVDDSAPTSAADVITSAEVRLESLFSTVLSGMPELPPELLPGEVAVREIADSNAAAIEGDEVADVMVASIWAAVLAEAANIGVDASEVGEEETWVEALKDEEVGGVFVSAMDCALESNREEEVGTATSDDVVGSPSEDACDWTVTET